MSQNQLDHIINDSFHISIIWLLIGILTLASNFFVAYIILYCQRLRNCANAILCSMLISGCAISVLYILPGEAFDQWSVTSTFLCSTVPAPAYATISCYGFHLYISCLEKVISILAPFRHRNVLTARNIAITIICLWTIPYLLYAIPIFYSSQNCFDSENITHVDLYLDDILHTVFFTFMTFVPIAGTATLYVVVFIKVNDKKRRTIINASICQTIPRSNIVQNWKIARQMIVMLGLFMISWLPICISFIIVSYTLYTPPIVLLDLFHYMALSYHILNPLLVAYFHNGIRHQIKCLFQRIGRKRLFSIHPYEGHD